MDIKDLHNKFLECSSIVDIDSRSIREGSMFFAIKGDNFDGNEFVEEALNKGAKYAIVDSDSVNIDNSKILRVKDSLGTLQKLATFHRTKTNSIVIALTGSNGKTTTKELIDCVLSSNFKTISTKGNYNNHIGVPLSLLQIEDDTEYSVIELGANNFGEIDFLTKITLPDYGYITNFGKAHLEGFIDIEGVIKAKTELYNWIIENNKTLILNFLAALRAISTFVSPLILGNNLENSLLCGVIHVLDFLSKKNFDPNLDSEILFSASASKINNPSKPIR